MTTEKVVKVTRKKPSKDIEEVHFSMFKKVKKGLSKKASEKKK